MEENYSRSQMLVGVLITGLGGLMLGNGLAKRSLIPTVLGGVIAYQGYRKIKQQSDNYKNGNKENEQ